MPEVIIYHAYTASAPLPLIETQSHQGSGASFAISQVLAKAAKYLAVVGFIILAISFAPSLWYWATTNGKNNVSELLYETAVTQPSTINQNNPLRGQPSTNVYQPRYDASLPVGTTLKISSIGVDTEIYEATRQSLEEVLKKGVWRASDGGTPFNRTESTILAAHRFGYLAWSNTFRRKHSFYNLPKLEVGETVEITYKQRKYVYEIYGESEGEDISDYSADLILYTCENLNSPVRIFKYARLLEV